MKIFFPYRNFRDSSFTIIEFLIVIAIIAILAAMLLPALNKARERGRGILCISNFKQIGTAVFMYADSNQGWMLQTDTTYNNGRWYERLWSYLGIGAYQGNSSDGSFLPTKSPYLCPSATLDETFYYRNERKNPALMTLKFNKKCNDSTLSVPRYHKVNRCKTPAKVSYLYDARRVTESGGVDATWECHIDPHNVNAVQTVLDFRHSRKASHLFLDGHAAAHEMPRGTSFDSEALVRYAGAWCVNAENVNPYWN